MTAEGKSASGGILRIFASEIVLVASVTLVFGLLIFVSLSLSA